MIKQPFNFWVGVFCGFCFVVGIAKGRDSFTLCISAFTTVLNLAIGIGGVVTDEQRNILQRLRQKHLREIP